MRNIYCNLKDDDELEKIGDALSSPMRRKILRLLNAHSYTPLELSRETDIALSTISFHLKLLKEAGLINMVSNPNKRGNEKNISQAVETITISFTGYTRHEKEFYATELGIGSYFDFSITPPCIMHSVKGTIGEVDSIDPFLSAERTQAGLFSFLKGWVEYRISTTPFRNKKIESLTFSLELCSECPNWNNSWKSDITFGVNDIEIGTYRSMGDYGDRRGRLNPSWYPDEFSQYGMLIKVRVDEEGTWIDNELIGETTIEKLALTEHPYLALKIGVKPTARYCGGVNLFGRGFGDHDQGILLQVAYKQNEEAKS